MKRLAYLAAILLLGACGFHLKGVGGPIRDLPYRQWQVVNGALMQTPLEVEILRQRGAQIGHSPDAASLVIQQIEETKSVQSINLAGAAIEYRLNLTVRAQIMRHGRPVGEPIEVVVHDRMDYSDSLVLGKIQEEARIRQHMREDAAERLVRIIAFSYAHP